MFHIVLYCFISLGGSCWRILELWFPLEGEELTACDEWIAPSRALFFCFSLHPWSSLLFPGPSQAPPLVSLLLNLKPMCSCVLSRFICVQLFVTPWTIACWAPLFVGFPRQECWSELPFLSPGDRPDPGIEPTSLRSPALASRFFTTNTTWEAHTMYSYI